MRPRVALALALIASGCDVEGGVMPVPPASYEAWVAEVQPVLAARCAEPTCHGSSSRALEVFALGLHRMDPRAVHRADPLTDAELRAGFLSSCGFLVDIARPEASLLLRKPLARAAGGAGHAGGVVFEDTSDRDYRALSAWVARAFVEGDEP
ncbi:MAG: hypothetical protein IT385_21805 [Deltaproteobacteria bacterium]|nr:hypothetical protein [Deltaproteobacteria bacterium]